MGPDVRQLTSRLGLPLGQGLALTRDLSQSHKGKGVRVSLRELACGQEGIQPRGFLTPG